MLQKSQIYMVNLFLPSYDLYYIIIIITIQNGSTAVYRWTVGVFQSGRIDQNRFGTRLYSRVRTDDQYVRFDDTVPFRADGNVAFRHEDASSLLFVGIQKGRM